MNKFSDNSMFLFVDGLADGSENFDTHGKITEIFDTGCDARIPGATFKNTKKPDAINPGDGSTLTNIPNVRKPFSLSIGQDKNPVKKNSNSSGHESKILNIPATRKFLRQSKLTSWNPKAKDQIVPENNGAGNNPVEVNQNDAEVSEHFQNVGINLEQQKRKTSTTSSTRTSSTYSAKYRAVKARFDNLPVPKECEVPEPRSTICNTLTNQTKSVTIPTNISSAKMPKVTSEASMKHYGIRKYTNRAVDKDSLSNCSRQPEITRNSLGRSSSKISYVSTSPRTVKPEKFPPEGQPKLEQSVPNGIKKVATSKTALMKISGSTDRELQNKDLSTEEKISTFDTSFGKSRNRPEGETASNVTLDSKQMLNPLRKPEIKVNSRSSIRFRDLDDQSTSLSSLSRSKITANKMPVPKYGRKSCIDDKTVQKPLRHFDKVMKAHQTVSGNQKSKSNEKVSSKVEKTDVRQCQDIKKKLSASENKMEKISARPSAKFHNLVSPGLDVNNTSLNINTKIAKPVTTSSIVPKLMNKFRLEEKNDRKVSKNSLKTLQTVSSLAPVKMEELGTGLIGKPLGTFGILSDQLSERLRRLSDQVQDKLSSKVVPRSIGDREESRIGNQITVGHVEQNKSNIEMDSLCLSRVKNVEEDEEEIELKSIFEDTGSTAANLKSSASLSRAGKVKESKFRKPIPSCPSATVSKVPRPVTTKCILKKEIVRNSTVKTQPEKQELAGAKKASKNFVKIELKTEAKPSILPSKKSVEQVFVETERIFETSVLANPDKVDETENVSITINPTLCDINSLATDHCVKKNEANNASQEMVQETKYESWIEGHEQAYLRGRAIGLKVANMARSAKEDLKHEFIRSGLNNTTPKTLQDKSQEIVEIGISLIEKFLSEKENKIRYSRPSVRGDQVTNYYDSENYVKFSNWFR